MTKRGRYQKGILVWRSRPPYQTTKTALSKAERTTETVSEALKKKTDVAVCGATLTAINVARPQTGQEEGKAAMLSAYKLHSESSEYSGMADWLRASGGCSRTK